MFGHTNKETAVMSTTANEPKLRPDEFEEYKLGFLHGMTTDDSDPDSEKFEDMDTDAMCRGFRDGFECREGGPDQHRLKTRQEYFDDAGWMKDEKVD